MSTEPASLPPNEDRRTPKARKAYGFLWLFLIVCVIFAAMVLFVKA